MRELYYDILHALVSLNLSLLVLYRKRMRPVQYSTVHYNISHIGTNTKMRDIYIFYTD